MAAFRVTSRLGGHQSTIAWSDPDGFDDPTGATALLIDAGAQVAQTPTGPFFTAAAAPAHVALLTVRAALDRVHEIEADDEILERLEALATIPHGAVA